MTERCRLRVLILIVAYEAEATIERVLQRIPADLADQYDVEILVIDDASTDRTFALADAMRQAAALRFPLHVLANPQNQGYGGNQKIGFRFALDRGFDVVALVHGDGQYAPESLPLLLKPVADGEADAVMGSRMMTRHGARDGGMPLYKVIGNRALTAFQNWILNARLSEYHSGYRLYSTAALRRIPFDLNANGFHFDTEIIVQLLIAVQRIHELPIPTHYGDEISRVKVFGYGWRVMLAALAARSQQIGLFYDRKYDCRPGDPWARLDAPRLAYDSPHRQALAFVKPGARVLLLGRGEPFAAALRERGCSVVLLDGPATGQRPSDRRHQGLDPAVLPASVAQFDLVLLLDGIDRVQEPEAFVDRLRAAARLAPHIRLIVSSANVGFIVTRLMLLIGQFNYGERGILDMTHYRLFTARTLRRLLEQGGFTVTELRGGPLPFPVVFGDGRLARSLLWFNGLLLRLSRSLFAYQIMAIATPRLSLEYLLAEAESQAKHRIEGPDAGSDKCGSETGRDDGHATPRAAALPSDHDALPERLAREVRAHDSERQSHAVTAMRLAHALAALSARAARNATPAIDSPAAPQIPAQVGGAVTLHPVLARVHHFSVRHPRTYRLLRRPAKLVWWTVTLQLPAHARQWRRSRGGPPATPSQAAPAPPQQPRFQLRQIAPTIGMPVRQRGGRRMVCLTHVLPHPAYAGNEYRIARMLTWLSRQGWEVLLIVCPLPDRQVTADEFARAAVAFPNLIACHHDGSLLHHTSGDDLMLEQLEAGAPRDVSSFLERDGLQDLESPRMRGLLKVFCPDRVVELLLHVEEHFNPECVLAEYVFMTRAFPLLKPGLRKIIDTIDVFSNKPQKVERFGIPDGAAMTTRDEAALLKRADLLIAIQPDEAADLRALAPDIPVIDVGVDFDIAGQVPAPAAGPVILLVASDNKMNVKGLRDFLRFAWPLVRREVPDAELRVIGDVGHAAEAWSPGIHVLGRVDDLREAYSGARLVINPAIAGTGLKIKTVEALSHGRPIVVWPSGVEGVPPEMCGMCHVATDWFAFAQHVIRLARDNDDPHMQQWRDVFGHFAPDRIYAPLAEALDAGPLPLTRPGRSSVA